MKRALVIAIICSLAEAAFAQAPQAPLALPVPQAAKDLAKDAPRPSSQPVSATPERTTASFGDWILRCEGTPTPAKRICEVAITMTVQGQTAPIAQIAFGRAARSDPIRVTLVVPTNVSFSKPRILPEKDGKSTVELTWERCLPGGCIATSSIADDMMTRLSKYTDSGSINFKDAAERDVALPLSFRGLSQALVALAKEP